VTGPRAPQPSLAHQVGGVVSQPPMTALRTGPAFGLPGASAFAPAPAAGRAY